MVARILPQFLDDFFPPQDVMNKVIGEFLSNQQPYPQFMATVVYKVRGGPAKGRRGARRAGHIKRGRGAQGEAGHEPELAEGLGNLGVPCHQDVPASGSAGA